jgi:proteasome accessory factor A
MKRRIFGLENEYGLTCTLNGERRLSPDNVARYLFEKVIPGTRNANVFLENGARLYLDTGFHPEYATPECDDPAELVIHDKAGSASSRTSGVRPRNAYARTGSRGASFFSRTTPTRPAIPTAATRITWSRVMCLSSDWPKRSFRSS